MIEKISSSFLQKYLSTLFFLIPIFFLSSCSFLGPDFMEGNRNEYNKVLANTNDEEVLLNLVRRRYADSIAILEVNSVSTSLEWKKNMGISAKFFDGDIADNSLGLGGNSSYSEKPTITYIPLNGADYVKNVLSPISLDTILAPSTLLNTQTKAKNKPTSIAEVLSNESIIPCEYYSSLPFGLIIIVLLGST